jgi:hypothetical protein
MLLTARGLLSKRCIYTCIERRYTSYIEAHRDSIASLIAGTGVVLVGIHTVDIAHPEEAWGHQL